MLPLTPKPVALVLTSAVALVIGFLALLPLTVPPSVPGTDKTHHLIAFAALVLPAAILSPRMLIWVLPLAILYGGLVELIQPYTGRFGEWLDFQADVIGALLGLIIGLSIRKLVSSRGRWRKSP